jgi:hypothetical protein
VGFSVFANQLGGIATKIHGRTKELFESLTLIYSLGVELTLGKTPQESAARLAICARLSVEPVKQVVGH